MSRVTVLGRFPPPADGQTLATERCAALLEGPFEVVRLDTQAPGPDPLSADPRWSWRRARHYLGLRRRMARALADHPASPVVWHAVSPAPLGHLRDRVATLPAFAPGQPVVAVFHRAGFEALAASPLTAASAARLVERMQAVVSHSPALARRCAGSVPEGKWRIIPNTVRDALVPTFAAVEARRAEGPGTPLHAVFLSNMLPDKGYADVLEAVGRLHAQGEDIRLTVAGRWPDAGARVAFVHRAAALGVADRVDVLGGLSDPTEVARLHLAADVFVLPTTHPTETQPIAILEALAAGTPVVSVDRPILRDMISDGVEGALVPAHDPAALAAALDRLRQPEVWRAASRAARARFDAAFHPDVVGGLWRDLAAEVS